MVLFYYLLTRHEIFIFTPSVHHAKRGSHRTRLAGYRCFTASKLIQCAIHEPDKKPLFQKPGVRVVCHLFGSFLFVIPSLPEPQTHLMDDDLRFLDQFIRDLLNTVLHSVAELFGEFQRIRFHVAFSVRGEI